MTDPSPAVAPVVAARGTLAVSLVGGAALFAACTALAARVYDQMSDRDGVAGLDRPVLRLAQRLRTPARDAVAATVARVFGPVGMPILTLIAALAASVPSRRPWRFVLIGVTGIGSLVMTVRDKDLVKRVRPPRRDAIPPYETSPSFPSGHTLNATAITGVVAWVFGGRRAGRTCAVSTAFGLGVGATRLLLGAHWLTDVLFAWLTGTAWLAFVTTTDRAVAAELAHRRARRGMPRVTSSRG